MSLEGCVDQSHGRRRGRKGGTGFEVQPSFVHILLSQRPGSELIRLTSRGAKVGVGVTVMSREFAGREEDAVRELASKDRRRASISSEKTRSVTRPYENTLFLQVKMV